MCLFQLLLNFSAQYLLSNFLFFQKWEFVYFSKMRKDNSLKLLKQISFIWHIIQSNSLMKVKSMTTVIGFVLFLIFLSKLENVLFCVLNVAPRFGYIFPTVSLFLTGFWFGCIFFLQ